MKILLKISLVILLIMCFSCEDKGLIVKCPDCETTEPDKATLAIDLTLNNYGFNPTQITVYEGNLEDSVIYDSFSTSFESTTVVVSLNKKYTLTASYYFDGNYYVAVDSATPRVRFEKSQCNEPCYFIYDKDVNLKLKYTK